MPILTAKFILNTPAPCLIEWPLRDQPKFSVALNDFAVEVCLIPTMYSITDDGATALSYVNEIHVTVSRNELEQFPEQFPDQNKLTIFLQMKEDEYIPPALEVSNRILQFFKFPLSTPNIRPIPP